MNACQLIVDNKEAVRALGLVAVLGIEAWMGKTDKVKAASILEALYNLIVKPKPIEETKDGKGI